MYLNTETIAGNVDIGYGIMISLEAVVIFPRKSYQHLESPLTTQHAGAGTSFLSSDCARKMVTWVSLLPAHS